MTDCGCGDYKSKADDDLIYRCTDCYTCKCVYCWKKEMAMHFINNHCIYQRMVENEKEREKEKENDNKIKYFFATVEYERAKYEWVMGGCYPNGWERITSSDVFSYDHYPTKQEIIEQIVGYRCGEADGYRDFEVRAYNELTKDAYDAYLT